MQRIDTQDGLYHDADTVNGIQGTVVKAAALNALQEEIIAVITAAGITLDAEADDQLYQAILAVTGNGEMAWGAIYGAPDTATRWPTVAEVTGLTDALNAKMPNAWKLSAGVGLAGGGDGSDDRTISLGTPSPITGSTDNTVEGETHTHALDVGTGADQIPRNKDLGSAAQRPEGYFARSAAPTVSGPVTITGGGTYGDTVIDPSSVYERIKLSPWTSLAANGTNVGFYDLVAGDYLFRVNREGGAVHMYSTLEVAGKVTAPEISADNIETTPSDAALKTNTRPTRWPGISRLVETVLYDMRDGSEVDAPGVIAQRVRAVAPDFVYRMRDGRLAVRYARLALACATDPEPVERLAALEARIEALESRL